MSVCPVCRITATRQAKASGEDAASPAWRVLALPLRRLPAGPHRRLSPESTTSHPNLPPES
uniref:Uncharacterized protein n=1 Tax=Oryza glumipatula TaxID=40148 RepID=A0A0D9Z3Q2_9ORYZ